MLFYNILGTLVKRVCIPLIRAIIRWPHDSDDLTKVHAVKELAVVNPWISMLIDMDPTGIESFAVILKNIFRWDKVRGVVNVHDGQPSELKNFCNMILDFTENK